MSTVIWRASTRPADQDDSLATALDTLLDATYIQQEDGSKRWIPTAWIIEEDANG